MSGKSGKIGKIGEDMAADYLKNKGYSLVVRNWRSQLGEFDIVGIDPGGSIMVFVEVKTTKESSQYGIAAEDMYGPKKRDRLMRAYEMFRAKHRSLFLKSPGVRFDLLALTYTNNNWLINHYENILAEY